MSNGESKLKMLKPHMRFLNWKCSSWYLFTSLSCWVMLGVQRLGMSCFLAIVVYKSTVWKMDRTDHAKPNRSASMKILEEVVSWIQDDAKGGALPETYCLHLRTAYCAQTQGPISGCKWSEVQTYTIVLMSVHLHSLSTRIFSLLGSSVRESTLFSLHQGRTLSRRVCLKRSLSSNEWHRWLWKIHSMMFIIQTCFVHIVLTHNAAKPLFETCSCFLIPFGRATHTNTSYMLHTARWIRLTRICFDPVRTCPLRLITYEHICGQPSTRIRVSVDAAWQPVANSRILEADVNQRLDPFTKHCL